MKVRWVVTVGLLVGVLGFAAGRGFTEEDEAKEMEEWMKLGTPGPEHKLLASLVGEWSIDGKHWMGEEPTPMKATSKMTSLFDGRYVREDFSGDFQGMPFQGISHLGYDNAEKKYVGTWIDSMSTAIAVMRGTYDAASKTFTWHMEMTGPGGKPHKTRMTTKVVSDKEMTAEMFRITDEGEKKQMEFHYTRK